MQSIKDLERHQKGMLSDEALSALQTDRQPFVEVADDAQLFSDDIIKEQLADLKHALNTGDALFLILGEHGAGKSVFLKQLEGSSVTNIQYFAVKGSVRFSAHNLYAGMLEAFKHEPTDKFRDNLRNLIPYLKEMARRGAPSVIVLDDADQLDPKELTQLLSSMLYINESLEKTVIRIALAARPEFENSIPDLLPEGADLPYSTLKIECMTESRALQYLYFRLFEADCELDVPFSGNDPSKLISWSGGLPLGLHDAAANLLNLRYAKTIEMPEEEDEPPRSSEFFPPPELKTPSRTNTKVRQTNKSIVLVAATVLKQVDDYLKAIKRNNRICSEYPEHLGFVEDLRLNLELLLVHTPIDDDAKPINEVKEAESRWRNIAKLILEDFNNRTSDDAIAERVLPVSIVLGCGAIGLLCGGPLGFGAGALAGKFIIGEQMPGAVADKIEKALSKDIDD